MALKHGCTVPSGITITGALIERVDIAKESRSIEKMDEDGKFAAGQGKMLGGRTNITIKGTLLSTYSLPDEQSGAATAASPKIDKITTGDQNEDGTEFTLEAHYHEDPPASPDY